MGVVGLRHPLYGIGAPAVEGATPDVTVGPRPVAVRTVGDGEADQDFGGVRVDVLADAALGDPRRWRELLDFSGIDDPRQIPPGAVLAVPPANGGSQ
jgi:hypothetical protein